MTAAVHKCRLLDGRTAQVVILSEPIAGHWHLMGATDDKVVQLWDECGRWRENGEAHPLDISSGLPLFTA